MKKILSICLVLVMMLSAFAIPASAESGAVVAGGYYDIYSNKLFYTIDENDMTATVVGYYLEDITLTGGSVEIPSVIEYRKDDYQVTAIDDMAFYQSMFTSITVPSTVAYIGSGAFASSIYLDEVNISGGCNLNYVASNAFMGTPYEFFTYDDYYEVLGKNYLFRYNGIEKEVTIPAFIDNIGEKCFAYTDIEKVTFNNSVYYIPYGAFYYCTNLKEVVFTDSVTAIGAGAFEGCTSLKEISIGDNVESLGENCFSHSGLEKIYLGRSVFSIGGAFKNCSNLNEIVIDANNNAFETDGNAVYAKITFPDFNAVGNVIMVDGREIVYYFPSKAQGKIVLADDVKSIGEYAFYGCKDLKAVEANRILYVNAGAFQYSGIEAFNAKGIDGMYMIMDDAFSNCENLKEVNLENVFYIGMSAFENCTSLAEVNLSDDLMYLGEKSFSNTAIVEITVKNCDISESAFANCQELEKVTVGEGVTAIYKNAFLGCPNLKTISLSKSVVEIDENAFNGCDNVTFELIRGTSAYRYIKRYTEFNFEVVGNYSLFQRIIDFFRSLFK